MQQTKIDRWLQNTFVNETLVMTVKEPPYVPRGIKLEAIPQSINHNFRFRMIVRDTGELEKVITELKKRSQTYTTRVQHRKGLAMRLFANPSGKSFSISLTGAILGAILMFLVVIFFPDILIEYFNEYVAPLGGKIKDTAVETWQDFFGDDAGGTENSEAIRETGSNNQPQ